jgi:SAM-dependent methyltransferase
MTGSYDPRRTSVGGLAGELARLDAQAALSFDEELRIFAEIGLAGSGTLLEVGCGSGAVTRRLRAALPATRMVALDLDPTLLAHAGGAGVPLVVADAAQLPIGSSCVDGALVRYVMQHLANPVGVLAEIRRVLRPGGVVALVDVDSALWGLADPVYPEVVPVHLRMAQAQSNAGGDRLIGRRLTRLLRSAGFTAIGLRPFAVTSDRHPMEEFAPLLGPTRLAPLVESGDLTLRELALTTDRWNKFRDDPDAWVMLLGFVAFASAPDPTH